MALSGVKVVEFAGLAPAPFAGLALADFGASVVRIDRAKGGEPVFNSDNLCRGKRSIALDLKSTEGKEIAKSIIKNSDVLIEPFRPGVMERLGFGPEEMLEINPRLVYARLTGFGQGGDPIIEKAAGHDQNYIALTGILSMLRRQGEVPLPPVNLLADFAGGGLMCAFGIVVALFERIRSGKGQVIDAAMIDGVSYLSAQTTYFAQSGLLRNELDTAGSSMLDSGAHFYNVYECKDGRHFSVGAIEPQFYQLLLDGLGLSQTDLPGQFDKDSWPKMKIKFAETFKQKTQSEWTQIFHGKDACAFPVLSFNQAIKLPHNVKRGMFFPSKTYDGFVEASPAPKLSRTPGDGNKKNPEPGEHSLQILSELGISKEKISQLLKSGSVALSKL